MNLIGFDIPAQPGNKKKCLINVVKDLFSDYTKDFKKKTAPNGAELLSCFIMVAQACHFRGTH